MLNPSSRYLLFELFVVAFNSFRVSMKTMYSNLTKGQAFPLATRVSLKPKCLKPQSLPIASHSKPALNPLCVHFTTHSRGFDHKSNKVFNFVRPTKTDTGFQWKFIKTGGMARARSISGGFRIRSVVHCSARSFSCFRRELVKGVMW